MHHPPGQSPRPTRVMYDNGRGDPLEQFYANHNHVSERLDQV